MSGQTDFAGLEYLDGSDPLSKDGYAFQRLNPPVIDRLARLGAVTHRHDAHDALPNPSDAPLISIDPAGGSIGSRQTIYVCYTLIDADGGETRPTDAVSILTPTGYLAPTGAPTLTKRGSVDGGPLGTLPRGDYSYAVTVTDGAGGETVISPSSTATLNDSLGYNSVHITGLSAITASAENGTVGGGWRLWRRQGGGPWYLMATGPEATDDFLDLGSVPGDCTLAPPRKNTTSGSNRLAVTVPDTQPAGTVNFAVYASGSNTFRSPALLGVYPAGDLGTTKAFADLTQSAGSPPPVNRSFPGANQIDPDTDLLDWHWKRPVANLAALPATDNSNGDVRATLDDHALHMWSTGDSAWHVVSGSGGAGAWKDPVATAADLPSVGNVDGDARATLDDDAIHLWSDGDSSWHSATGATGATGPPGDFHWENAWDVGTTYTAEAVVGRSGSSYVSLAGGNVGNDPATDGGVHWELVAEKGADGTNGADGAPGADGEVGLIAATQQGGDWTFALTDRGTVVEGTDAAAQTFTVPPESDVAFADGAVIEVFQYGAGQITIAPGAGVTLRSDGAKTKTAAQYATIGLRKRTGDEWVLSGDLI